MATEIHLSETIEKTLDRLDSLRLIRFDRKNGYLSTTELGSITSHFYVKCDTMDIFCKEFGISAEGTERTAEELLEKKMSFKTDLDILKILAKAKEFDQIRMRNEEMVEIKKIINNFWVLEEKPDFAMKKMCSTDTGIV